MKEGFETKDGYAAVPWGKRLVIIYDGQQLVDVSTVLQANKFIKRNPGEAHAIAAKYIANDSSLHEWEWEDYDFTLKLNQSLIVNMEDQARWMISSNLTDKKEVPDFTKYLYTDGLLAVKPEAVTIIR